MKAEASGTVINGKVNAPSSKSALQRYIAGALLADGISQINSVTLCDDAEAAIDIAGTLGADINVSGNSIRIKGGFRPRSSQIFCGESGLSARMFTPIAALHNNEITINGRGSVLKRPFDMTERPLSALGAVVVSENGYLPLKVRGPLRGGEVFADGSVSSQFITGLLMALPVVRPDSVLVVENLVSKPYIELTLKIQHEFGIEIINENFRRFSITGGQSYRPGNFTVEGDWSGAAFLMVMGAIAGEVMVTGLDINSMQADRAIIKALLLAGADVNISDEGVKVSRGRLDCFEFDISDCPDLAPPLTVLAAACRGKTVIRGAGRLAAKESDRGMALEKTMRAIGARVVNNGHSLEIEGGEPLKGGTAGSFNDHRIAMALAASALLCVSPVMIEGFECINKSYPGFADDYRSLGGTIKLI
jgi:3-phosphoshikimate 1-carboxyvinyltransferase